MMARTDLTASQQEALALLTFTADRLERAVSGLSEKQLDYSPVAGEWTVRQIVHHLVDGAIIWSMFFNTALATSGETVRFPSKFPGNEAWANALDFDKRHIDAAVALVTSIHRFMTEAAMFFPDRWERYVAFPDAGGKEGRKITAGQIIRMLGEHLTEHLGAIEEIRRNPSFPT